MNKITIIGNLTADPEMRATNSGKDICNFTVAVKKEIGEGTDFFRVTTWEKLANNCKRFLAKGKKVAVCGSASCSAYTTKSGEAKANLEINAREVEFLSPKDKDADFGSFADAEDSLPWE